MFFKRVSMNFREITVELEGDEYDDKVFTPDHGENQ